MVKQFQIAHARFRRFRKGTGQTFGAGVGKVRRMSGIGPGGHMGDAASVVGGGTAAALNHQLGLGGQGDAVGVGGDIEFGQQVDAVLECSHINIARRRHQSPTQVLYKQAHALAGTGQEFFANGQAGMAGAAQPQMLAGGDMGRFWRTQRNACRTGEDQMWLAEFRKFVGTDIGRATAGNAAMLGVQRLGHEVLITRFLRLMFHGL